MRARVEKVDVLGWNKSYDIINTREPMRFKGDFINVENKVWNVFTEVDNNFVFLFIQNVISKETECELQIPSKFKELMDQKTTSKSKNMSNSKGFLLNLKQHGE